MSRVPIRGHAGAGAFGDRLYFGAKKVVSVTRCGPTSLSSK